MLHRVFGSRDPASLWSGDASVREELFGVERLEQHAETLAAAQRVTTRPAPVLSLRKRLDDNAAVLLAAYRASAAELDSSREVAPAAEWLLDNYHLVEAQIREIRDDLPPGYYRQLPKLASGPFAGYPRVFGLAWAFVAHTDSHVDPSTLRRFVRAYQRIQPLTIGELWAVAITLRIVLIENLRRLADQIAKGREERAAADALADKIARSVSLAVSKDVQPSFPTAPLSDLFAAQLAKRLRDQDPLTTPALGWLEDRLGQQDTIIDDVVHRAQQRQGASNVTVRNIITSMRLISDIDWADLFESVSLVDESLNEASGFAGMDFPTRNLYRSAIEQLGRGSELSELEIARRALAMARTAAAGAEPGDAERVGDPGLYLVSHGRPALEREIGFRAPIRLHISRLQIRLGMVGYIGAIATLAMLIVVAATSAMAAGGAATGMLIAFAILAFIPATEVATSLVNRAVTWSFGATVLPAMSLAEGVPARLRTLVAVPTLLTNEADLLEQIERLEVHHLSGIGGDISFAILCDGMDWDHEDREADGHLLAVAGEAIERLNSRHRAAPGFVRFHFLHRRRKFNASEGIWMGWERKRGKLHELNRLLRGATDTSFRTTDGRSPDVPADVRYVITLDADTRLPRDAANRLIGKMAHPLNRPSWSAREQRVVDGYAILQPRVTPSLPVGTEGSAYQRIFSAPSGMDPYAAAVSDVYQDLFGEGSYTGKGIYDVDAFEAALAGRVPENTMLSHDLFEGVFARAGLASDVEVVEEFPARYDVASKRQHRWVRGDWQLLPWIFGFSPGRRTLPAVGRGKLLDNLRRSLVAPFLLAALGLSWFMPISAAVAGTLFLLATIAVPALMPIAFSLVPPRSGIRVSSHLMKLVRDLKLAATQVALTVAFLPDHAWRMGDAIGRTLTRLFITRRHLLEWTTAARSSAAPRSGLAGFARHMAGGTILGVLMVVAAVVLTPTSWPLALPFAALWLAGPAIALLVSRSPSTTNRSRTAAADLRSLRLIARRTWRYFETFVTPADSMLPPDNFQEDPEPVIAHRTSPTNIGLYLLSTVAARDLGWAGTVESVERLEAAFASMRKMRRFKGHFFNWYETTDLRVLDPAYISSVDSGNLAGHLIALANACEEWSLDPINAEMRVGLSDTLELARQSIETSVGGAALMSVLEEIRSRLGEPLGMQAVAPQLRRLSEKAVGAALVLAPGKRADDNPDIVFWTSALRRAVREECRDREEFASDRRGITDRLLALAAEARGFASAMDFAFLLNEDRHLLSIGYALDENTLDPSCYDLLASEARLASLFAIAKGDVKTRHWFRLGRSATPLGNASALISWSGSMFEYLMPSLVIRAPTGSLLDQTNRLVVERQQAYGRGLGIPWGVSESAYSARDLEFTYQYSNFGVPGLGLKRGLGDNTVVAPYATGLASMVDPGASVANFARLAALGAVGQYGFYEAVDFTKSRLPDGQAFVLVRNFMAHHQGMTIVAIANTLQDGRMRDRFHREPMIKASELLIQERMPRDVAVLHPRAEEVRGSPALAGADTQAFRRFVVPTGGAPITHLLSNGSYSVLITATGGGYSRWSDIAVTRWREDPTRDHWGSALFLRDTKSGETWSATAPSERHGDHSTVTFSEDWAEFVVRHGALTTTMDVLVSGEHNGEVRRISLANSGREPRDVELTTYAELVLTTPAADNAHPAFAKMFVQTEYLAEFGALVATRRPRSPDEPGVWAAHFTVVEGELTAGTQYETDRARFFGSARSLGATAVIADGKALSNTVGTVLDPIFSVRQTVRVTPGKCARLAFWTVIASTREELLDLIDTHHERSAFDRAKTLAWTQAQVELRHVGVTPGEAADFQRLAAPILYADLRFRIGAEALRRGLGAQEGLWPHAISGDLPIVVLRIDDMEDMRQVRQLLRAHEYWRSKRLGVDLVILNERRTSYVQDLQVAIETAIRSSQSRPRLGQSSAKGSVFMLRADLMSAEARALVLAVARVVLVARRGDISTQLAALTPPTPKRPSKPPSRPGSARPESSAASVAAATGILSAGLEYFNGFGGFADDGKEYVTILGPGRVTPAPWINVIANAGFGFQVSAEGSGYTWAENSRENQLTQWSNDPVLDPSGEAIYVRDDDTGDVFGPTAQPVRGDGVYVARHGFGYTRFEHEARGVALELLQFVPLEDPVKISRLRLRNTSPSRRRLSVTGYAEWVLGTSRGSSGPFIMTEIDPETGAMLVRNPWNNAFDGRVTFADLGGRQTSWTADRSEFLGRNGGPAAPDALTRSTALSRSTGAGLDPCTALQTHLVIEPGESVEVVWLMGQTRSVEEARDLVARYRSADIDAVLGAVRVHWDGVLGAVQVRTPDRAMDIMLNGWLLYQTLACRITARSAFYQASGAYGFRDQLQDTMALTFARPEETRSHLLRVAGRQFEEGDVQHWWLPHSGQGVRTRISDDRVWLAYAVATYVVASGDEAVLDELVPFLDGPPLRPGEHDAFFRPAFSDTSASLFEHCARGLDECLSLTGEHGLPLIGTGDWNDGMNRVGEAGRGESVWLGWLLIRTIDLFAPLADNRDPERAARWRAHAVAVHEAIENHAWDGEWYRRATFDDGTWLGSKDSQECRIDSIAQSWAVLSGAGDARRAAMAMASVERHLIRSDPAVALLFTPPFDRTSHDPGYIKGYPPGLRENGGQYSHAAMWAILAFAELGSGDKAAALFALLNPINHATTAEAALQYKVEPYVVAADVYSVAPHEGRGGWTWYTGAAGWMYRAGVEGILGLRREGMELVVDPRIPRDWSGFEARIVSGTTRYRIKVKARTVEGDELDSVELDGVAISTIGPVRVPLDGMEHELTVLRSIAEVGRLSAEA